MSAVQVYVVLAAALSVAAMLWTEGRAPRLEWLFKPLASLCFVTLALQVGALQSVFGTLMLAGLLLCLCGDVLLIHDSARGFLAGLTSFLLGHLLYAAAFLTLSHNLAGIFLSLPPVLVLGAFSTRWLLPQLPDGMRAPVLAYITVICAMLLTAGGTWTSPAGVWIVIGAWGFAISDLSVARNQFVSPGMGNRLWGIPLYYGAQLLLAWSIRFA